MAELTRMVPRVAADSLGQMMLKIETDGRLRAANDAVLGFMREHRIASLWGRGLPGFNWSSQRLCALTVAPRQTLRPAFSIRASCAACR